MTFASIFFGKLKVIFVDVSHSFLHLMLSRLIPMSFVRTLAKPGRYEVIISPLAPRSPPIKV